MNEEQGQETSPTLSALTLFALRLGVVGFGGGLAVLGMIQDGLERRGWVTRREFLQTAAVAQTLPGSASTNCFTYFGLRHRGIVGALCASSAFVLPSAVAMCAFAWGYDRFHTLPQVASVFAGLGGAVVGLILAVTLRLARDGLSQVWQAVVVVAALLLHQLIGMTVPEVAIFGIAVGLIIRGRRDATLAVQAWPLLLFVFARVGAAAFGGGFTMIPFVESEAVERFHWLTPVEFADAMTLGQITPGPVLISATFIGWRVAGLIGALAATMGVFAVPFLLTVVAGTWITRNQESRALRAALEGLTPAVIGLMLAAALSLGQATIDSPAGVGIAVVALASVYVWRVNAALVIFGGGILRFAAMRVCGI